ncbi:methylated-DNA--[protein]-cysteine S-methyltransferase [Larsenimonas rhizosphaerae]|uniref:Methylated-DNA--protein-cysteine methyltransferase n=1 Tax=Larsenimonas rhizosphaerae TaxID=2944682 RepID=A0AA42CV73_9GAMM|nr:methylated-DNA--[protein]-cysteine S-methyltransferase [Larsenimonas rhizosphaerae]MCX2525397.1 methylated-DNA--[protein]-cysteine S-methyltransferase [Larsenimonas rhizosphaerae]
MTTAHLTLADLPIGTLRLTASDHALTSIEFLTTPDATSDDDSLHHPILEQAARELCAYLAGHCHHFTVPLEPQGTPFQHRVWQALQAIPWGEVRSYGEIARAIEQPEAARAVGMANNKNPLPIMIPCHRVVGSKGQLTGYSGGLTLKEQLLALEQAQQSMALI